MHCLNEQFTIGRLWVSRNAINEDPVYQRESAIWSKEKQQLFIDSILSSYDVPKLYFHDLRGTDPLYEFAVVDGKQRLHAIWQFLTDQLGLGDDTNIAEERDGSRPEAGQKFSQLNEHWREWFKAQSLTVVLIQNAAEDDIEELFSRLNNGEPLTAAEKRNARAGDMTRLIRKVAGHKYFRQRVSLGNKRMQHHEVSAKLLLLEKTDQETGSLYADLKKKFLDAMVDQNKTMTKANMEGLGKRVDANLDALVHIFDDNDLLLRPQTATALYYLLYKRIFGDYAHAHLHTLLRDFIQEFQAQRIQNLSLPEEERDPVLTEFSRLMQQGTNDLNNLRVRVEIMVRYFLQEHPEVELRDPQRYFNDEERYAIWILKGKQCEKCKRRIALEEMDAHHDHQWAHGGPTNLSNARCLCSPCHDKINKKNSK